MDLLPLWLAIGGFVAVCAGAAVWGFITRNKKA